MSLNTQDEMVIVRGSIINGAFRSKYVNVSRMLRDLSNVQDFYSRLQQGDTTADKLNALLEGRIPTQVAAEPAVDPIMAKLDAIEARLDAAKL